MPDIVAHGKRPDARACGLCHYPNGKGRQENAGVSGLPLSYFIQQMNDFRSGVRKSADSRKANTNAMIAIAKAMTPDEIKIAAEYFGAMKWTPWIRVVETATVPKMESRGGIWIPLEGNEKEPIGVRIMETPENPERTEIMRDPRSGFIAYAPVGSINKGEALVKRGNGKTVECGVCGTPVCATCCAVDGVRCPGCFWSRMRMKSETLLSRGSLLTDLTAEKRLMAGKELTCLKTAFGSI